MKIGAVFSPLSPMLSPNEAEYQLNDRSAETLTSLDLLYPEITGRFRIPLIWRPCRKNTSHTRRLSKSMFRTIWPIWPTPGDDRPF